MQYLYPQRVARLLLCLAAVAMLSACTGFSWSKVGESAKFAATDPVTWVPLAGAAGLLATGFDNRLSKWAVDRTPVFSGTQEDIADKTDDLQTLGRVALLATTLLSDPANAYTHRNKPFGCGGALENLGVDVFALLTTGAATETLKSVVERDRPNMESDKSFPSGHASQAATAAGLAVRQIDCTKLASPTAKKIAKASLYTVSGLNAWGRVEAQKHHVADVLVGYGLGNFFAQSMNHYYFSGHQGQLQIGAQPTDGGAMLSFSLAF